MEDFKRGKQIKRYANLDLYSAKYIKQLGTYNLLTSSPFPQNLASSSMPSSLMTVESTSKHTQSAVRNRSLMDCWGDITLMETSDRVFRVAYWMLVFRLLTKMFVRALEK